MDGVPVNVCVITANAELRRPWKLSCIDDGNAPNSKQAKTCTIQSHQKGIPLPVATVCTANMLSSAMTDRETDSLTMDEPIRWKMPEGKKEKKNKPNDA